MNDIHTEKHGNLKTRLHGRLLKLTGLFHAANVQHGTQQSLADLLSTAYLRIVRPGSETS